MRCQSSKVPTTPMSTTTSTGSTRQNRRHEMKSSTRLRPDVAAAAAPPIQRAQCHDRCQNADDAQHHHTEFQNGRRRDEPSVDVDAGRQARLSGHLEVGEHPGDLGFSASSVPVAPGMPMKSAPTPPTLAQTWCCRAPEATAALGATAATESRNATTTELALAVTNSPLRVASMPRGMVDKTRPRPRAGWRRSGRGWRRRGPAAPWTPWRGDVGHEPVRAWRLRPDDGGGGLLDRQQWHQPAQHHARNARDDGNQPGDAVGRHEARW